MTYANLAEAMAKHGHKSESAETIQQKLKRRNFSATFLLAAVVLGLESVVLEEL